MGSFYNGTATQSGSHVTVVNAYYNGTVAAGRTTEPYSPWFIATGSGAAPLNCRINGNKCDGSADRMPNAPTGLSVTARTTKTVSLQWTAAVATDFPIASYDVYAGTTLSTSVTGTSATVSGLTPNTAYSFTVRAKDTRGNVSSASAAVSATTLNPANDTTPPSVPGSLKNTAKSSTTVSLAWNASSDANGIAGYDVFANGSLKTSVTGLSTVVSGLAPLTPYTFTVKARDTYDNQSAASNAVTVTTDDVLNGSYAKVGYFVQWGIYGRQYFVNNLVTSGSAAKLTHINYAFANVDPVNLTCLQGVTKGVSQNPQDPDQGTGAGDADADYARPMAASQSVDGVADTGWESLRGNYNQLRKLKVRYPNLKVLISIGGWTYSKFFSNAALTPPRGRSSSAPASTSISRATCRFYNGAGGPGSAAGDL
jgi:chitinase